MTNRRFINSVIASAQTCDVQMPWHRSLRAAKPMMRKGAAKTQNVVILSDYHIASRKHAA